MATTSLFYSRLVCHWGCFIIPPWLLPLDLEVCSFCSPHPLKNSCSTNMFWEIKSEVCGGSFPKRDSEIVSYKRSEDAGPTFCNVLFSLLTFLGKKSIWRCKAILRKRNALSLSSAFGLLISDKYQAANGDVIASPKWKRTWNLTCRKAHPIALVRNCWHSPHNQVKVTPILRGQLPAWWHLFLAEGSLGALGDLHRGRSRCCSLQHLPVRAHVLGKHMELRARLHLTGNFACIESRQSFISCVTDI